MTMPYNTRRKSLSLPALGIPLPSRPHAPKRSPENPAQQQQQHSAKKLKRAHDTDPSAALPPSPSLSPSPASAQDTSITVNDNNDGNAGGVAPSAATPAPGNQLRIDTPPPSPRSNPFGIDDDIVAAVVNHLARTGNRPRLVRELADTLAGSVPEIAESSNSIALVSSRLGLFIRRPWSLESPCPLTKISVSRKVYFQLTETAPEPTPLHTDAVSVLSTVEQDADIKQPTPSLVSGSAGSFSVDSDDADDLVARESARLSPSPEVDLAASAPAVFEDDDVLAFSIPGEPSSIAAAAASGRLRRLSHHRSGAPRLEGDEEEFTQTASSVRDRTSSEELRSAVIPGPDTGADADKPGYVAPEDQQQRALDLSWSAINHFDSDALFGTSTTAPPVSGHARSTSTTTTVPASAAAVGHKRNVTAFLEGDGVDTSTATPASAIPPPAGGLKASVPSAPICLNPDLGYTIDLETWSDLRSPESIGIDELDEIFSGI